MRLSVRALRRARPELFVNYISRAFIAPEPPATEKPPPPPQTASRAPGAPASRRPGCDGSAGPEISGSPTRDLAPEKGGKSPAGEVCSRRAGQRHVRWTDGTWTPDGSTTAQQCVLG
ncbi:protein phosphatase 1D-like isoform X1 [Cervus elaphus]|uniref:protein phosphatase 1D-like isoform X1 n=1 Tax=Cervus canadensis TaxID=1574408 RepID=UPI001C9E370E|nr:protein phosphatase 1D-like isoform X1 [Cervus canadensis]XP_043782769.1 protein phosphatase 1D-like isoform X1 [Cervus elaphus]